MLSVLLEKSGRGILYYQEMFPDLYAPYAQQLNNLRTQLKDLEISLTRWGNESEQQDDPCPPQPKESPERDV